MTAGPQQQKKSVLADIQLFSEEPLILFVKLLKTILYRLRKAENYLYISNTEHNLGNINQLFRGKRGILFNLFNRLFNNFRVNGIIYCPFSLFSSRRSLYSSPAGLKVMQFYENGVSPHYMAFHHPCSALICVSERNWTCEIIKYRVELSRNLQLCITNEKLCGCRKNP